MVNCDFFLFQAPSKFHGRLILWLNDFIIFCVYKTRILQNFLLNYLVFQFFKQEIAVTTMHVIGCGFGRTGTLSLKTALDELGKVFF